MVRILLLLTLLIAFPASAQPEIVGDWSGVIHLSEVQPGAGSLTIIFHVSESDDGYVGTIDSPDQGSFGLPLSEVVFDGETFSATLAAASASYSGVFNVEAAQIEGTRTQGPNTMPLVLTPYETPDEPAAAEGAKPSIVNPAATPATGWVSCRWMMEERFT